MKINDTVKVKETTASKFRGFYCVVSKFEDNMIYVTFPLIPDFQVSYFEHELEETSYKFPDVGAAKVGVNTY